MTELFLAIDLGTSAAKAALFDRRGRRLVLKSVPLKLTAAPAGGWEQDPLEVVRATRRLLGLVSAAAPRRSAILAAGIASQRSTVIVWDRATHRPVGPAVSWMDLRAAGLVARLRRFAPLVERRTGLRLSPHYGAAHLARRLRTEPALRRAARRGQIVAGPVVSFVLSQIGRKAPAACDATLAQRTLLYDPFRRRWDESLCALFGIPPECLPEVGSSIGEWGSIPWPGGKDVAVRALAGDQQAGAAAFDLETHGPRGMVHYGTGAFLVSPLPPGRQSLARRGLLCSARADSGGGFYLEGTVNAAGRSLDAVAGWIGSRRLRSALSRLSASAARPAVSFLIPAFAGLGAPHWDPSARATLVGAGTISTGEDLAAAALAGIAHRIADITEAAGRLLPGPAELIASGPLASLPALVRLQADLTGRKARIAQEEQATLLGIARLASIGAGTDRIPPAKVGPDIAPRLGESDRRHARRRWRQALRISREAGS